MFSWVVRGIGAAIIGVMPVMAAGEVDDLDVAIFDALRQGEIIEIMRDEGIAGGRESASAMFATSAISKWEQTLDRVYDTDVMFDRALVAFGDSLAEADRAAILEFFTAEPGQTVIALEVSARAAMLDADVTDAALERGREALEQGGARSDLIVDFMRQNDLVERNVAGSLNAMIAFYAGLQQGGGLPEGITLDVLLGDLIAQEEDIRTETTDWMFGYLTLAYAPVSDEKLADYLAFAKTDAGQALNNALFDAYDELFNDISRVLGYEAARIMIQAEL